MYCAYIECGPVGFHDLGSSCYGNGVDDEDAPAAGPMHVDHANRTLYTDMRLGHLHLQKHGHPGGPCWGLSIRGAGWGHLLVRAVAHGAG